MHRVVPDLIVENYSAGRHRGEFSAIGMLPDVSGCSPMAKALVQHGQHGAEVLAGLMHGVFDPLAECAFDDGERSWGSRDGSMALYPVDSDTKPTALQALTLAYLIPARLRRHPIHQEECAPFLIQVLWQ